jgi:Alr-MurF fusion protein
MIGFTLSEIADIINGELFLPEGFHEKEITEVVTDSRTFFDRENALFFALKGPRNNGHDYIQGLIKRGLKAFVVSEKNTITPAAAFILVDNTTSALHQLAAHYRKLFDYPVIGITGSNGKTIIKEWLHDLLSEEYQIVRSPKSYNSQIGVPLSVLLMTTHYDLAIFEAGISKPGEMQHLSFIIQPDIGILTNIGDAHQENFISHQQKTEEKLLLFNGAKKIIFRVDDKDTNGIIQKFCEKNNIEEISWTLEDRDALIRFTKYSADGITEITADKEGDKYNFKIPFTDDSAVENACNCFAAVTVLLDAPEKILHAFGEISPIAMRLEIKQGINNCLLINDYYNSDLASLAIGMQVLHQQAKKSHLKKHVILSDIRQTGMASNDLYKQVNQLLEQWKIDEITGIGPEISNNYESFSVKKSFYPDTEIFIKKISRNNFFNSVLLIKGARAFKFEKISSLLQLKAHQTVLEIDMNALVHNLNIFRGLLRPSTKIMVMVKAFSYGSGDIEIAKLLEFQNVDYLAVAVADEGVKLREAGIQTHIIVMNPEEHSFQNMVDYQLEPNIYSLMLLKKFSKNITENGLNKFPVHIKIDTGMNRLGLKSDKEIEMALSELASDNILKIKSVFSHLAASDDKDSDTFTHQQLNRFDDVSKRILNAVSYKIYRHILNSSGIERFPDYQYDMVRLGIGLYGISATNLPLRNISTFKSMVSQVKKVNAGESVGYGRKAIMKRDSKIAVVPTGYADGIERRLGNGIGEAFVKGHRVPFVGNICMDMLMLDVTGINVVTGDTVEFFGHAIPVSEVAQKAKTIPYEILTGISQRVKRIYLYE